MKFDIEKNAYMFLTLLILADIMFLCLHTFYTFTDILSYYLVPADLSGDLFSISFDGGYGEMFQYIKEFWIFILLLILSIKRSKFLFFFWALLFLYLLVDDSFQVHERLADYVDSLMHSHLGIQGDYLEIRKYVQIRVHDFSELSVHIFFGTLLIVPIAISHYLSDINFRRISTYLFIMVVLLVFCGVIVDIIQMIKIVKRAYPIFYEILGMIDDGGEMLVMSVIAWFTFYLNDGNDLILDFRKKVQQ